MATEKEQLIQPEDNPNSEEVVRQIDWKRNILTKVLALICFAGWVFGLAWGRLVADQEFSVVGGMLILFWVILPAGIIGFTQIIISAIRWKKLTILDKIISIILLVGITYLIGVPAYYFLLESKINQYQNSKIEKKAIEQDDPALCGKIKNNRIKEEYCYQSFAVKRQDPMLCKDDKCLAELALILKDPYVCERLPESLDNHWSNCYERVVNQIWGNIEDKEAKCQEILGAQMTCDGLKKLSALQYEVISSIGHRGICRDWFEKNRPQCFGL